MTTPDPIMGRLATKVLCSMCGDSKIPGNLLMCDEYVLCPRCEGYQQYEVTSSPAISLEAAIALVDERIAEVRATTGLTDAHRDIACATLLNFRSALEAKGDTK